MLGEAAVDDEELLDGRALEPPPAGSLTVFRPLRPAGQPPDGDSHVFLSNGRSKSPSLISLPNSKKSNLIHRLKRQRRTSPDDESHAFNNATAPWLASRIVGGLRADPFNSLPVEPRDCVPNAVDHFVQIFIPERILRPFGTVPGIQGLAQAYFQLVINDVCLFEATVAQSQASFVAQQAIRRPTKEVLHHHGKALSHLQQKLSSPEERVKDETIHSILAIMGTHFFFGELDAHQAHLDGLWSLIRMRGGIDTLGWNGTLKHAVETVTSFRSYASTVETPTSSPAVPGPDLDYPRHPFSADLCETIAKLPLGFGELALERKLSIQMIDLLGDIHEQIQTHHTLVTARPPKQHTYEADKCVMLLKASGMNELERMVCAGLLAYTVQMQIQAQSQSPFQSQSQRATPFLSHSSNTTPSSGADQLDPYRNTRSPSPNPPTQPRSTVYDDPLRGLLSELARFTFFNYEHDVLVWIVYTFAAIQRHLMQDRLEFFQHTLLRFKQGASWASLERVLRKFFWTEADLTCWHDAWDEVSNTSVPRVGRQESETSMN